MAAKPELTEEELQTKVSQLRDIFFNKYADAVKNEEYDPRDVQMVREDDNYLKAFVKWRAMEVAPDKVNEALRFRKEHNVNDFNPNDLPSSLRDDPAVYVKGTDKQGQPVLIFKVAKHKKGENIPSVKSWIAAEFDKHHKAGHKIVILFDFTGAGVTNMDLDLTKFLIGGIQQFPGLLAYILMFEMSMLLGAIWKVIKTWLTAEQLKYFYFVKKKDITQHIDESELEPHMLNK